MAKYPVEDWIMLGVDALMEDLALKGVKHYLSPKAQEDWANIHTEIKKIIGETEKQNE